MRTIALGAEEAEVRLDASIFGLARAHPELSASTLLSRSQKRFFVGVTVLVVVAGILSINYLGIAVMGFVTAVYIAVVVDRVLLFVRSRRPGMIERVSDEEARAVSDDELPVYTILVPAYKEPQVIGLLLAHLAQLEYPYHKLDIKLLLEADDEDTIAAVVAHNPDDHVQMVLVPAAEPRTKPKALNYALSMSPGEIVTIYDAEDQPEPLQLRRAAVALARSGPDVACIQAQLSFSNVSQNLITRWFTLEYAMWFAMFLPGLVSLRAPLPLGGTSNHFRREILDSLGAWDPFNVTEDADLGIRMARSGYRCSVLESVTLEEANSDFVNWIKQRSRWYKGYLQTSLIHLRQPRLLYRQLRLGGFVQMMLFVLGTPLLAVLNPFFWGLTGLWFIDHPHFIRQIFPAPVFYAATLCWILGNFVVAYLTVLTCRLMGRFALLWAALLIPVYWVMMAIAATKAFWQLIVTPNFWEKTHHGLSTHTEAEAAGVASHGTSSA